MVVGTPDASQLMSFPRTFEPQRALRLRPDPPSGPIVGEPDADYSWVLG